MCDVDQLNRTYITSKEPSAIFWSDVNCQGTRFELPPGQYNNLNIDVIRGGYSPLYRGISSMWIPPNIHLHAYSYPDLQQKGAYGIYGPGLYKDLQNPQTTPLKNHQITSLQFQRINRWNEHLVNCCSGKTSNNVGPDQCGLYWGKGSKVNECEQIVGDFCKYRPDDKRCSCYPKPIQPTDTSTMRILKSRPICYSQNCHLYGYIPESVKSTQCPLITICQASYNDDQLTDLVRRDCDEPSDEPSDKPYNNPYNNPSDEQPSISSQSSNDIFSDIKSKILNLLIRFKYLIFIIFLAILWINIDISDNINQQYT